MTGLDPTKYPFLQDRPAGSSLEGFLFPDTYNIPAVGATPADVFERQLDSFAAKVIPAYEEAVANGTTDLDLHSVLTLASIVEREAVIAEERPDIAAVYLNRIANGIALEADPTVQYAMGYQEESGQWWKTPVFLEEYGSVISPYNTYLNAGLPPGPIASPGLSSIQAVLSPRRSQLRLLCRRGRRHGRPRLRRDVGRARRQRAAVRGPAVRRLAARGGAGSLPARPCCTSLPLGSIQFRFSVGFTRPASWMPFASEIPVAMGFGPRAARRPRPTLPSTR